MRRILPVFLWVSLYLCLGTFPTPAFAADKWLSIHTKNFLLVGNASESDIRRVGRTLEEFRSAVSMTFPKMEQTSSVPTTIMVLRTRNLSSHTSRYTKDSHRIWSLSFSRAKT